MSRDIMVIIEMLQKLYQVMISCSSISVVKDETPTRCIAVFHVELLDSSSML